MSPIMHIKTKIRTEVMLGDPKMISRFAEYNKK